MSKKTSWTERAFLATSSAKIGVEEAATQAPTPSATTAPGAMAAHLSRESQVFTENRNLKDELRQWEGSLPTRLLNPKTILPSKWANRHEQSFESASFEELKAEIEDAGGNVQPIKVRLIQKPLATASTDAEGSPAYEIVFGHRRHRACLELGLWVNAVVESVSDGELFVQMDRENRNRKDLSAWEQGAMYARALDEGLFPSSKKMALALGVAPSNLGRALVLARLPEQIVAAFNSPLDLQFRWASILNETLERDRDGMLARAEVVAHTKSKMKASEILAALTQNSESSPMEGGNTVLPPSILQDVEHSKAPASPSLHKFKWQGKAAGLMRSDAQGRVSIKIKPPLSAEHQEKLAGLIDEFLKGING